MRAGSYVSVTFIDIDIQGLKIFKLIMSLFIFTFLLKKNNLCYLDSHLCQDDAIIIHDGRDASHQVLKTICGRPGRPVQVRILN